jgi:hypothetical protein
MKIYLLFILIINIAFKLGKDRNIFPKFMYSAQNSSFPIFALKHIEIYLEDFN